MVVLRYIIIIIFSLPIFSLGQDTSGTKWSSNIEKNLLDNIAINNNAREIYRKIFIRLQDEKVSTKFVVELLNYKEIVVDETVIQRFNRPAEKLSYGLDQSEFELFFKQIRKFLTVQEQIDLFVRWKQAGSLDAGFLSVISLTAAGFSWRKPERLVEARKQLGKLNIKGFDPMPMLA